MFTVDVKQKINNNEWVPLIFIWYLTINKIQVEFEKEGYALIWPVVMVPGRRDQISLKLNGTRPATKHG